MAERDPETEWLRVQIYRRMTPQQRIEIAAQMFEEGVDIVRSSILDRDPDISHPKNCSTRCAAAWSGRAHARVRRKRARHDPGRGALSGSGGAGHSLRHHRLLRLELLGPTA